MRHVVFPGKPGLANSHRRDDCHGCSRSFVTRVAKGKEEQRFFDLAAQLTRSKSRTEQMKLKEALARLTFGG